MRSIPSLRTGQHYIYFQCSTTREINKTINLTLSPCKFLVIRRSKQIFYHIVQCQRNVRDAKMNITTYIEWLRIFELQVFVRYKYWKKTRFLLWLEFLSQIGYDANIGSDQKCLFSYLHFEYTIVKRSHLNVAGFFRCLILPDLNSIGALEYDIGRLSSQFWQSWNKSVISKTLLSHTRALTHLVHQNLCAICFWYWNWRTSSWNVFHNIHNANSSSLKRFRFDGSLQTLFSS